MFTHISSAIRSRRVQVHHISSWRQLKLSTTEMNDCLTIRDMSTSLLDFTNAVIETLPPQEAGTLFSVLYKCTVMLAVYMISNPMSHEFHGFIVELKHYVSLRCPNTEIDTTALEELWKCTCTIMRQEYETVPEFAAAIQDLNSPYCTHKQMRKVQIKTRKLTMRVILAVFHESLPKLREKYSFGEMLAFSCAYRREKNADDSHDIPIMGHRPVEYAIDDTEVEYHGFGERVELSAFCKPVESVPDEAGCCVCMTETAGAEEDQDSQAVVTKCGHVFHELCLDQWVNDSGMKSSNTCPACRTLLCSSRGRLHASIEDEYTSASSRSSVRWLMSRITAHLH